MDALTELLSFTPQVQKRFVESALSRGNAPLDPADFRARFLEEWVAFREADSNMRTNARELDVGDRRRSNGMNNTLKIVGEDLFALYSEAALLEVLQAAQLALYRDEFLADYEDIISAAEDELELLKLLRANSGYTNAGIADTFNAPGRALAYEGEGLHGAYTDPKLKVPVQAEQLMSIDGASEGLVLPVLDSSSFTPRRITVYTDGDVLQPGVDPFASPVTQPTSPSLETHVEGTPSLTYDDLLSTSFQYSLRKKSSAPAYLTLRVEYGANRRFNFLQVDPASPRPMKLENIHFIDTQGNSHTVQFEQLTSFNQRSVVRFAPIVASVMYVTFSQETPRFSNSDSSYWFRFGIAELRAGMSLYQENGYYVTKTLTRDRITRLKLYGDENDQLGFEAQKGTAEQPLPVFEYWCYLREFDAGGNLLRELFFPLPNCRSTEVREKLFPNQANQVRLLFSVNPALSPLSVYRDGSLLVNGADYSQELVGGMLADATRSTYTIGSAFEHGGQHHAIYTPLMYDSTFNWGGLYGPTDYLQYNLDGSVSLQRPPGSRADRVEINAVVIQRRFEDPTETSVLNRLTLQVT